MDFTTEVRCKSVDAETTKDVTCPLDGTQQCSVCLEEKESMASPELKVPEILTYVLKHLDLELELKSLCQHCFSMLKTFHEFYMMVKEQHAKFNKQLMETAEKKPTMVPLDAETEKLISMEFVEIKTEPLEAAREEVLLDESSPVDEISIKVADGITEGSASDAETPSKVEQEHIRPLRLKSAPKTSNRDKVQKNAKQDFDILEFYQRLVCELCDPQKMITGEPSIEYSNLKDLNRHMRKCHGQDRANVKCPQCDKKFRSRVKLLEHKEMHLNPDRFRCEVCKEIHQNMEEHMKNRHQERTYCCDECGKRFPSKSRLTAHVRKMHTAKDVICEQCQKPFSKYTIEDHKRAVHGASYICEHCPRTFKTRYSLEQHMEEHVEGLRRTAAATCEICGIVVRNKYSLSTHIKRMHTEHPPVNCRMCGKEFKSKHNLDAHLVNVCTDRSFPCSICGKQFKKKIKLNEHMTTHTKSALYQCPFCEKTFSFETQLYTHRKQVHYEQWLELQRKRKEGQRFKLKRIAN